MKRYLLMACAVMAALMLNTELALINLTTSTGSNAQAQTLTEPELPRVFLNTNLIPPTGITINVAAGGNLQAALNAAVPGDEVVLQAGATFIGNFTLPNKPGAGWITIRTSNVSGIPAAGARVVPALHAGAMPKVISPNSDGAIVTQSGAHNYRLIGLEIGIAANVSINYGIIRLGTGSETSLGQLPRDITIDRCYIHGNVSGDVARGVALNSVSSAVIDSHISECHGVGFDTQAICGWNGPGPFKIVNNYLEGAGENVMFGGADPKIIGLVPSDIEFRRNHCFKPLSWNMLDPTYAGRHWTVKNIFELKNARRVLVEGNIFENNWSDGQSGASILFTPRNQDGTAPWSAVQDVMFRKNIVRNVAAGVNILGTDYNSPSQRTERIKIENNVFDGVGAPRLGENGRLYQITNGGAYITINHNTAFQVRHVIVADGGQTPGFVYTNNITATGEYGIFGSGAGEGTTALVAYFPASQVGRNVLTGRPSWSYPANNYFPTSLDQVGFVNRLSGNYRLASNSPYKNMGTDGRDIGADIDAIQAAMAQTPQATNQVPRVVLMPSTYGGACPLAVGLNAEASDPDGRIVSYLWDCGDGRTSTEPMVWHVYQTAGVFTVRLTVTDNLGATATAETLIAVTTGAQAHVKVSRPNTRETLKTSSTYTIEWSAGGCEFRFQEIELSLDNGQTWHSIVQDLSADARSFTWRVPKTTTQQGRIRVTSHGYNGVMAQDMSDTTFIIAKSGR